MKKIKSILTVLGVTAIVFTFHAAAPPVLIIDYLCSPKMWVIPSSNGGSYDFIQFTKTHATIGRMIRNQPRTGTNPYYLSDTEVSVFDSTKVGKVENGKYIIISRHSGNAPKIYEIKSIDWDELVIFYDSKGKNIPNKTTSTWQAKN